MDFSAACWQVVDGNVEWRIIRRREQVRGTQVAAGAGQPVADEFERRLIHRVSVRESGFGETGRLAGACSDLLGREWERSRPWESGVLASSEGPVATGGRPSHRCRARRPSSPHRCRRSARPRRGSRTTRFAPDRTPPPDPVKGAFREKIGLAISGVHRGASASTRAKVRRPARRSAGSSHRRQSSERFYSRTRKNVPTF